MKNAKWIRVKRSRLPKTGFIVAGSFRSGRWTTSTISCDGWAWWFDSDRTHYVRLPAIPKPPRKKP